MPAPSHFRRIAVIALLGCAILSGWSSAATARPIYDRPVHTTSTAEPRTSPAAESGDWTLPIVIAGGIAFVLAGTAVHARRSHASRRVTA